MKKIFLVSCMFFLFSQASWAATITVDLGQTLSGYANQGSVGTSAYDSSSGILKFTGDTWKVLNLGTMLATNSIITFQFRSDTQGELHGIGFDSDTSFIQGDSVNFFQLYGTQDTDSTWWQADQSYKTYSAGGWVSYSINLLNVPTTLGYLIFVNDNDANKNLVTSEFRNFTITSVPVPAAVWMLGTGLAAVLGMRRKMTA